MFKRSDRLTSNGSSSAQGLLNSILGDSSRMNGSVQIEGSVRIDGDFEGTASASETIVIGRTGFARADLDAREILVAGRVHGKLMASERVELQEGAHVDGSILAPCLVIAEGVFFSGTCTMEDGAGEGSEATTDLLQGSAPGDRTEAAAAMQVVKGS